MQGKGRVVRTSHWPQRGCRPGGVQWRLLSQPLGPLAAPSPAHGKAGRDPASTQGPPEPFSPREHSYFQTLCQGWTMPLFSPSLWAVGRSNSHLTDEETQVQRGSFLAWFSIREAQTACASVSSSRAEPLAGPSLGRG